LLTAYRLRHADVEHVVHKGTKVLLVFQVGNLRVGIHDLFASPDATVVLQNGSGTFSGEDAHCYRATGSFTC
jgi:hypothetical protein